MILHLGSSSEEMIFTLTERKTLSVGYYLVVFTHYTRKKIKVSLIYNFTEDTSDYPARFNNLPIDTSSSFSGKPSGQWTYIVCEQSSNSNTDPDQATELERGIMTLVPATAFEFDEYSGTTTFAIYNG